MSNDFYEDDEPVENVVRVFEEGKKGLTVPTYIPRQGAVHALQWNKENKEVVLKWLEVLGIGYTHHEIRSAGELYIYLNGGPVMVNSNDYIVKIGLSGVIFVSNEESFTKTWASIGTGDR